MTARPQDVALLPLPELPVPHGGMTGDYWTDDQIEEYATDYARANVTAALASAQAREDELLAALTLEKAGAEHERIRMTCRIERLAEALREIANQGPHYGRDGTRETWRHWADIAKAALSTNAATQTGETNEAAE